VKLDLSSTAEIARRGLPVREVPVSYYYRTLKQGKKSGWKDGFRWLACTGYYGAMCMMPSWKYGRMNGRIASATVAQLMQQPEIVPAGSEQR
jgi:hypothetical protein